MGRVSRVDDPAIREQLVSLINQGATAKEMAEAIGSVNFRTVVRWVRQLGLYDRWREIRTAPEKAHQEWQRSILVDMLAKHATRRECAEALGVNTQRVAVLLDNYDLEAPWMVNPCVALARDQKADFIQAVKDGESRRQLAEHFGIGYHTVVHRVQRWHLEDQVRPGYEDVVRPEYVPKNMDQVRAAVADGWPVVEIHRTLHVQPAVLRKFFPGYDVQYPPHEQKMYERLAEQWSIEFKE